LLILIVINQCYEESVFQLRLVKPLPSLVPLELEKQPFFNYFLVYTNRMTVRFYLMDNRFHPILWNNFVNKLGMFHKFLYYFLGRLRIISHSVKNMRQKRL